MRFQVDFVPFLLVPSLILWLLLMRSVPAEKRGWFRCLAGVAFGWSALVALTLSLHGASDDLRRENPALFASLEARVEPLRVLAARLIDPDDRRVVRLRAAFPERLSADEEPLLSWGTLEAYDVLWVKQPTPEIFVFPRTWRRRADARLARQPGAPFRTRPVPRPRSSTSTGGTARATVDGRRSSSCRAARPLHQNRSGPAGARGHGAPAGDSPPADPGA
jgi:hypothetical protein